MQKKILTFIIHGKKILALYSAPHPQHGEGGWFIVTGAIENEESPEEAVRREIKEETDLLVKEIFPLNWGSIYNWNDKICKEYNFVSFVNSRKVTLNEEHSKYKWLDIDKFIEIIKWDDDKELLREVLEKALYRKTYFKNFTIKDYRREKNV
jgi:8-oxo-dGTP diphosphatase